jgi:hypothetical protein
MMRSESRDTIKAYATFRVIGDNLNPESVTKILHIIPTFSYSKGEAYNAGKRTGNLVGKTGLWAFSTDGLVASDNLHHHISYILGMLIPGRQDANPLAQLHMLLSKNKGFRAELRCFWHGRHGAKRPSIPKFATEIMKLVPAIVEANFGTDSESDERRTA